MEHFDGTVCAIGGGKGGVGKSFLAVNLACALALEGNEVILVDADLAGANVHTLFGIRHPPLSLHEFLDRTVEKIEDVLVPTSLSNLHLICGATDFLELANPKYAQKQRILRAIGSLAADYVVIDIGAGATLNNLDFFNMADVGIIVTAPEPTAMLNGYEFLKLAVRRKLVAAFAGVPALKDPLAAMLGGDGAGKIRKIGEVIDSMREIDADASRRIASLVGGSNYRLVVNSATGPEGEKVLRTVAGVASQFLQVGIRYLGNIARDDEIGKSVRTMTPVMLSGHSAAAGSIRTIARRIVSEKPAGGSENPVGNRLPVADVSPGGAQEPSGTVVASLLCLNEEVVREGRALHIQTEDLGAGKSQVLSLVFRGGQIVFSKSSGYAQAGAEGAPPESVRAQVRRQHSGIVAGVRMGKIDREIAALGGDG